MIDLQPNMPTEAKIEEYVLGALLLEPVWHRIESIINEDCFTTPDRKTVFRAIRGLSLESKAVDIGTVWAEVQKDRERGSIKVFDIASLTNAVGSSSNILHHAEIIRESAMRRSLINEAHSLYLAAHDTTRDTFELMSTFENNVKGLNLDLSKGIKTLKEATNQAIEGYEKAKNREPIKGSVKTYCGDLDDLIYQFKAGDFVIIAARPAMGKTVVALTMLSNNAERNIRGVMFQLEMSGLALVKRMACSKAMVNSYYVDRGELQQDEHARYLNALTQIAEYPIGLDETGGIELSHLCSRARKYKQNFPDTEFIIIDYLQLITLGKGHRVNNREQEVSTISRTLKSLAKELGIPIIALSQLSRAVESRSGMDKRPQLSDLRESGSLEQDADAVIFLYRPAYYEIYEDEEGNSTENVIEFVVRKFREGQTGIKKGNINLNHQRITRTDAYFIMPQGGNNFDEF